MPEPSALPAITILNGGYALHRFEPGAESPGVDDIGGLRAWVRTPEGVTLVCKDGYGVDATESSRGWSALAVEGPLDFGLTGILAGIATVLAEAEISIFAVSCWETDYVLVRAERVEDAAGVLRAAGYPVRRESSPRG